MIYTPPFPLPFLLLLLHFLLLLLLLHHLLLILLFLTFQSVQLNSVAQSCPTLCDPVNHSMPVLSVHHQPRSLPKLMSIESVMPSSHLILCHPFLFLSPIPPRIRVFSNESTLRMRWPKCWSFSFSISSSNEYSGLISFRIDWLDLLAVQGTLKSLLQHHAQLSSQSNSHIHT